MMPPFSFYRGCIPFVVYQVTEEHLSLGEVQLSPPLASTDPIIQLTIQLQYAEKYASDANHLIEPVQFPTHQKQVGTIMWGSLGLVG